MSEHPPDVPCITKTMGVNCGRASFEENGVWLTIRDGGTNKTALLEPVQAIVLAQRLLQAADDCE